MVGNHGIWEKSLSARRGQDHWHYGANPSAVYLWSSWLGEFRTYYFYFGGRGFSEGVAGFIHSWDPSKFPKWSEGLHPAWTVTCIENPSMCPLMADVSWLSETHQHPDPHPARSNHAQRDSHIAAGANILFNDGHVYWNTYPDIAGEGQEPDWQHWAGLRFCTYPNLSFNYGNQ